MPDNGVRISAELRAGGVPAASVEDCADLAAAVSRAAVVTPAGGVVLLSPAASSFGRYANYLYRSRAFADLVGQLATAETADTQAQS